MEEDIKALERFPPREPQRREPVLPTPGRYVKTPLGSDGGKDFLALRLDHYHKTIDGKDEVIKCSILDRERGYINKPGDLPDELSYPELCAVTFYDIPYIEDPRPPTEDDEGPYVLLEYTNKELLTRFKTLNKKYGYILPISEKTIKSRRDHPPDKGFIPYCHQIYEGTPIGDLLRDHLKAGRGALSSLHEYFMSNYFFPSSENKAVDGKYCIWPRRIRRPTRETIVKSFQSIAMEGMPFAKEDLAEKRFDLLANPQYGIIKGWEGYTNKKQVIYFATQKSGPHQIPKEPCNNTQARYILNNKTWDKLSPSEAFRAMFQ